MIFAAAFLPLEGTAIVDSSPWVLARIARRFAKKGVPRETPAWLVRFAYVNGVPLRRHRFMHGKLYPESLRILTETLPRREMPSGIPRTWILTGRDRALSPKLQRKYIEALGGVQSMTEVDTCHCLMVSEPELLAEILVERCRQYT
ncbi:MAG TPA: alpha/beta hydrolase [Mycobacterium sp.]|nr:alpha/beta hydrolase [Mycobacterium sp.]HTX95827.1 alpha/beta hydrolase [Mycobacterium sp.]